MNIKCRFFEVTQHGSACGIGVNFYMLGEDCALCEDCAVPTLDDPARCKYLQFHTVLSKEGGKRTIRVELSCALSKSGLEDVRECLYCPTFESMLLQGREAIETRGVLSHSSARPP